MGIATQPSQSALPYLGLVNKAAARPHAGSTLPASMSQSFNHQGIFSFSEGFDRSANDGRQQEQQQHHIAQQSRRDKLRVQGFDAAGHPLVPIGEEEGEHTAAGIYEPATVGPSNMLAEMFNFQSPAGPTATELLASQISGAGAYRLPQRPVGIPGFPGDWYAAGRQGMMLGSATNLSSVGETAAKHPHDGEHHHQQHTLTGLNVDSAAAMELFLMNPPPQAQQHPRSPSRQPQTANSATLHHQHNPQAFHAYGEASFPGGVVEGQGLSLSLSSSLQQFEMAKPDELRVREGVLYFNNNQQQQQHHPSLHLQGPSAQQVHMGYGSMGVVNVLRNSKYARAAQELLEEFCSVGRGQSKSSKVGKHGGGSTNPNPNSSAPGASTSGAAASSSSSKDAPQLSPADRFEHQRKKTKLVAMLDEVDRRYNHYCDQMQMVVNSFDSVMGFGSATPYTALAQKAMSRHFRCLKDAIVAQLKQTCELLGEKDTTGGSGLTKGETPRLRVLDQSLRQQRAFHQMGMMEQEAWRPQRGLPERSVNILRAWLFEHFLHPYPSDADKLMLARQTGLNRNQVSNWFINARVRLWKPMVEEMYQHEFKDDAEEGEKSEASNQRSQSPTQQQQQQKPQLQQQQQQQQRAETNVMADESDPSPSSSSIIRLHHHRFGSSSESAPTGATVPHLPSGAGSSSSDGVLIGIDALADPLAGPSADDVYRYGSAAGPALGQAARMRFGAAGDVSLTLGLRHAGGNAPEKSRFAVRDFSGC